MKIKKEQIGKTVAERLRMLDKRGFPGATLTDAGIVKGSNSISNWGKGVCPDLETVIKAADYYGVTVSYLIGESEQVGNEKESFSKILDYFMELSKRAAICIDIVNPDPYDVDPRQEMTITENPRYFQKTDLRYIVDYLCQVEQIEKTSLPEETKELCKREIKESIINAARPVESEG